MAAETVDEVLERKLLVPCTTRWNSFHDAVARVCEFPIAVLNTISYNFGLKAITDREYQFLREYCTGMKSLTVALDILQGEDNCFYGTPTHTGDIDLQDPGLEEWPANPW